MDSWQKILDKLRWYLELVKIVWLNYWSWPVAKIYLFINLTIVLFNIILAYLIIRNLGATIVILHYNILFGIDYVGAPSKISYLPAVSCSISLLNIALAASWYNKDKLLCHLNQIATIFINLIICLGLYSIYLINFVNIKL